MIELIRNILVLYAVYFVTVFVLCSILAWNKCKNQMEDEDYEFQNQSYHNL